MSRYYPEDEGLFTNAEGLSAAEQALGFAHTFGEDFQLEPAESLAAAPEFLRKMVNELQADKSIIWLRSADENKTGSAAQIFVDGSSLEVYIGDYPYASAMPDPGTEIIVELRADTGIDTQREITYELRRDAGHVIRTEITSDELSAFDKLPPRPDNPDLTQAISKELHREAAMLRAGLDPSGDRDIEFFRLTDAYFEAASNSRRQLHASRAWAREMGLNEQPVGIQELVGLRHTLQHL